ncbi:hypothetical protein Salat_2414200 [Sesamum alatum]|uniref:Uncharacterized protein n=1 Tax=Sesamum alatum TaxID=300844 RepID=A0AAE1XYX1_9LAMI|nr:hypothetical protein Salat_2414200 [Sesamum alatum]
MDSPSNNIFFTDNDFISSFMPINTTMQNDESSCKNILLKKWKKSLTDLDARYIESIDRFVDRADLRLEMMSKRMGFEFDASEARKKVYEAICKVGPLKVREKLFVAKSLDLFFSLPDDEKAEFIHMMLDGSV